jgi:hypothetical protein
MCFELISYHLFNFPSHPPSFSLNIIILSSSLLQLKSRNGWSENDMAGQTEVFINELENRAKDLNIFDLRPFYRSTIFRNHGLRVDERRQVIVKFY